MPKARPLPADPVAAAKVIRRREQVKRAVDAWRNRHPSQARLMYRHCWSFHRQRQHTRKVRESLQA